MLNEIFKKLLIKESEKLLFIDTPTNLENIFKSYGDFKESKDKYDRILIFISDLSKVNEYINIYNEYLYNREKLYFIFPKKTSKKYQDTKDILNRDTLQSRLVSIGWRIVTLYSLDEDWTIARVRYLL